MLGLRRSRAGWEGVTIKAQHKEAFGGDGTVCNLIAVMVIQTTLVIKRHRTTLDVVPGKHPHFNTLHYNCVHCNLRGTG